MENQENEQKITCASDVESRRAYARAYYAKNREKLLAYRKDYCNANPEKCVESKKKYYIKNREKLLAYQKEYCSKNHEKFLEYQKEYHNKNHTKSLVYKKEYYAKNREKCLVYKKEYYEKAKANREMAKNVCPAFRFMLELKTSDIQCYKTNGGANYVFVQRAMSCPALTAADSSLCPMVANSKTTRAQMLETCTMPNVFKIPNSFAAIKKQALILRNQNSK